VGLEVRGWGLGLQSNNLLLITVDNYNTILLITQETAGNLSPLQRFPIFRKFRIRDFFRLFPYFCVRNR
jgi:hypothetical protein